MSISMALLSESQLEAAVRPLSFVREENALVKVVKRRDFAEAIVFVNEVARLAEEVNHHPDIDVRWNTVVLSLSTHSAGGITEADVALAHRIDALG